MISLPGHTHGSIGIDVDNTYLTVGDALMNMFDPTVSMLFHNKNGMLESAGNKIAKYAGQRYNRQEIRKLQTNHKILWYAFFGGGVMQRILVVEDDLDIQELLKNFLQEVGYDIVLANDGVEALAVFSTAQFDLVLLDVMLPKIDGFAVCELIRKQSKVPIIMLTALSGEEEQIRGLDLQVDDYITKPFSMPILVRKIAAVLRRSSGADEEGHKTIAYQNLVLDYDNYTATVSGTAYELTQREFEVLKELLTHQGRILTRQNLLDKLWRYDFYGDERVVDTHIKNLRKKLGIDFIQTIRGVGYKIEKEN